MTVTRQLGYIAVSRSLFEHPLFKNRPDWCVAWVKLIGAAAWKPQAHAGRWGSAHVERGQLATTQRALAKAWEWPSSTLRYFLDLLENEEMIVQEVVRAKMNARERVKNSQRITIITICNYDKFQPRGRVNSNDSAHRPAQRVAQEMQELPLNLEEVASKHFKQEILKGKAARDIRQEDTKPNHQQLSRCKRFVWWDYGTEQWAAAAADYRNHEGSDIFPQTRPLKGDRVTGKGNWFVYLGQAFNPDKKPRKPRKQG